MDGWITGKRFGQRGQLCRLGCQEPDSVQHYANCKCAAMVATRQLGLTRAATPPERLERFLLVADFDSDEDLLRQAQWTGSMYSWHNLCRHAPGLTTPARRLEALRRRLRDTLVGCNTTTTAGTSC